MEFSSLRRHGRLASLVLVAAIAVTVVGCAGFGDFFAGEPAPEEAQASPDVANLAAVLTEVAAELKTSRETLEAARAPQPGGPRVPETVDRGVRKLEGALAKAEPVVAQAADAANAIATTVQQVRDAGGVGNMTTEQRTAAIQSTGAALSVAIPPLAPYIAAGTTVASIVTGLWGLVESRRKKVVKAKLAKTTSDAKSIAVAFEKVKQLPSGKALFNDKEAALVLTKHMTDGAHDLVDEVQNKKVAA